MAEISGPDGTLLMQIQNAKKPDQIISVIAGGAEDHFETSGLRQFFGLDEIRMDKQEFIESMEEFAGVLSFLLETMSAAQDYNLPYMYQDEFDFGGKKYSLPALDGYRVLHRAD